MNPQDTQTGAATIALTHVFEAPLEEVVPAMWRHYQQRVATAGDPSARMDAAPADGIQCLNLPVTLDQWPQETPDWLKNRWAAWKSHHSWMTGRAQMLWRWCVLEGADQWHGATVYEPLPGHRTRRHVSGKLYLETPGEDVAEALRAALCHHFEKEHAAILTMLSRARP